LNIEKMRGRKRHRGRRWIGRRKIRKRWRTIRWCIRGR